MPANPDSQANQEDTSPKQETIAETLKNFQLASIRGMDGLEDLTRVNANIPPRERAILEIDKDESRGNLTDSVTHCIATGALVRALQRRGHVIAAIDASTGQTVYLNL